MGSPSQTPQSSRKQLKFNFPGTPSQNAPSTSPEASPGRGALASSMSQHRRPTKGATQKQFQKHFQGLGGDIQLELLQHLPEDVLQGLAHAGDTALANQAKHTQAARFNYQNLTELANHPKARPAQDKQGKEQSLIIPGSFEHLERTNIMNFVQVLALDTNRKDARANVGMAMERLFKMIRPHRLEVLLVLSGMCLEDQGKAAMQVLWLTQRNIRKVVLPPLATACDGIRSEVSGIVQMIKNPNTGAVDGKPEEQEQESKIENLTIFEGTGSKQQVDKFLDAVYRNEPVRTQELNLVGSRINIDNVATRLGPEGLRALNSFGSFNGNSCNGFLGKLLSDGHNLESFTLVDYLSWENFRAPKHMRSIMTNLVPDPADRFVDRPVDGRLLRELLKSSKTLHLFIVDAQSYSNFQPAMLIAALPATIQYFKVVFGYEAYLNYSALGKVIEKCPGMKGLCAFLKCTAKKVQRVRAIEQFVGALRSAKRIELIGVHVAQSRTTDVQELFRVAAMIWTQVRKNELRRVKYVIVSARKSHYTAEQSPSAARYYRSVKDEKCVEVKFLDIPAEDRKVAGLLSGNFGNGMMQWADRCDMAYQPEGPYDRSKDY
ncbi:uncharacterized protein N0V89_012570 [Didymosphaeria variabile]|uniref:Uncharacterized protein n=1 Tax=Didymosphaeria variabile TaxID=1932322 RepID=A0A9W8X9U7_9PLEO|nr:uncharacterized protein N0V89_012570 [Didymosphaeria variabile]KAJ4344826.1 hypothetical protein N0V89_012570 [Didymosphaeria variabile]